MFEKTSGIIKDVANQTLTTYSIYSILKMIKDIKQNAKIDDDEIDLKIIFNLINKERKLITILSTITTTFCILIYFNLKPTWQGRFQIVVREDSTTQSKNNIFAQASEIGLGNLGQFDQGKRTQELILKSPSVLMPVYEFNKKFSQKNNIKIDDIGFDNWFKKSFNIFFEKGSNVLTIEYKSKNKELIKKTLNLTSIKYQNFAKINKDKYLNNITKYLMEQQKLLTIKSDESMKAFNNFTVENRLASVDGFTDLNNFSNKPQDALIKNLTNTSDLAKNSTGIRFESQFALLDKYETKYINLSSKLKPQSKIMIDLKAKIELLRDSLKRPNEILTKYRKLKLIALKDEQNLSSISRELDSYKLEQALQPLPWDLISNPEINQKKIFPNFPFLISILGFSLIAVNSLFIGIKNLFSKSL